ncbi:DUF2059 domain-containing protein [Duganella vulcania]|uniref:DUF2059 domain-containing protein n=1 Tax=Duganella vulcania TaxID=2692166 RepID=A0A845GRI6_9BURK|nr:DUF2059 domain-containing protein [Duganella vulcania]MYM96914.1 DUF2059 domain-containing protein [Duganella vulcania]
MKKLIAAVLTTLAFTAAAPSFAQAPQAAPLDPASVAAARELFESMNYRATMVDMMKQMSSSAMGSIRPAMEGAINGDSKLDAAAKKQALEKLARKMPEIEKLMNEFMSDPALVDETLEASIPLYARTYTVDEIHQIAAFYRTPVGVKMLATMPRLSAELMQNTQGMMTKRLGALMQRMMKILED